MPTYTDVDYTTGTYTVGTTGTYTVCSDNITAASSSTTISPSGIYCVSSLPPSDTTTIAGCLIDEAEIKGAIDKTDKHVDELEQDIEYFNGALKSANDDIDALETLVKKLDTIIKDQNTRINNLTGYAQSLEKRLISIGA